MSGINPPSDERLSDPAAWPTPVQPGVPDTQPVPARPMDAEEWRELFQLREAVKGPAGFATWKDAAVAERVKRVAAEAETDRLREALLDCARKAEALKS